MTEALFAQPRRRVGQSEALLAKTLRAWHEDGVLVGETWAAARGVLRDMARAVDHARDSMRLGEGSAYSFARTVELYRAAMATYYTGEGADHDGIDDLIAAISAPPIRDET